jgi:hypothetical protein
LALLFLASSPALGEKTAPVPPTLEIAVLDPNADPLGNPAIELYPSQRYGGRLEVDIPPVVLVHRYYYTGDRSFQGPMLPGGPSIVVCNHPRNGGRCYIPVQMLPGAPTVHYTSCGIEYDYGRNGIKVAFGLLGRPRITYRNCTPLSRVEQKIAGGVWQGAVCTAKAARLPEAAAAAGRVTTNLGCTTCGLSETAADVVVNPLTQLINATPIGSVLCKQPEDIPQRIRDREVRQAARQERREDAWIPTVR